MQFQKHISGLVLLQQVAHQLITLFVDVTSLYLICKNNKILTVWMFSLVSGVTRINNIKLNLSTWTLTLIPLTWRIWWAPNNASRWQMGFNWAFKLQAPRFLYIGQAFRYSPENAFYIFNQQIYFIIWYLLDCASLI